MTYRTRIAIVLTALVVVLTLSACKPYRSSPFTPGKPTPPPHGPCHNGNAKACVRVVR